MSSIVLGCDYNGVDDRGCQNTVAEILEKAGNTVEKIEIAPNPFALYSYSDKAAGKIGIYLMADSIVSIADLAFGNTNFKYAYFGIRGDLGLPRMSTKEHFQNNPISPDADCTGVCDKLAHKTYPQMNEIVKDKCTIVFGATPEELGNELVKAMGGDTDESQSSSNSASSIKEAIKEVQSGWDGDVECFIRDDTFYVRKIRDPSLTKLSLVEDVNIIYNSIKVTDVNPSAPNQLVVNYNNQSFVIEDEFLIKRFGLISNTIDAIDVNPGELESFIRREWAKLKRDNGHKLECKTIGKSYWKQGEWCRVYSPSFEIDDYMYITKVSHDTDERGNWLCGLVLVDYPPSLGKPEDYEKDETGTNDGNNK